MSLISRDLARVLGSTAVALVLASSAAVAADAEVNDGAALSHSAGTVLDVTGKTYIAHSTTTTSRAWGVLTSKNTSGVASVLNLSNSTVQTTGTKAHGIQVGANGGNADGTDDSTINLSDGVNVTTSGNDSYGLHAIDGGTISGDATIETTGASAHGAFAESYSTIDLTGGSITTHGNTAHGLLANNDRKKDGVADATAGSIDAANVAVTTNGLNAYGAYADNGGQITLTGGSITSANTTGQGKQNGAGSKSYAIYSVGTGSLVSADGTTIQTNGQRAYGARAEDGGEVKLSNLDINTKGFMGYGIYAIGTGSQISTENVNITTTGDVGDAAWAVEGGTLNINGGTFTVNGGENENAPHETTNGLVAIGGTSVYAPGTINAENLKIVVNSEKGNGFTSGADEGSSIGQTSGAINLTNSEITAVGANSSIGWVQYNSSFTATGSKLSSNSGIGIGLTDNAVVTLNKTTISSAQETFQSNLNTAGQTQTINLGDGTVATQNNGTLLKVNREATGGDGIVNLNLQAGSTSSGDIVDTDATKTTGLTNVKVEQGATYNGKIEGIEDLNAESGTELTFAAGTEIAGNLTGTNSTFNFDPSGANIGGDVELNDGSSTHGGSIDTPITVGGSVIVDETSIMGGNWDIAHDLTANGTITPGNSIGVIKVGGDATFGADSVYAVEIAGDGTSDRIDVTGKATLQGGTVEVTALDDKVSYQDGQTYTILTAGGGVDGQFSEAVSKSIFLTAELQHLANEVDLTVGLVADPVDPENPPVVFEKVAKTSNQVATARALDSLEQSGSSLELYNSVLFLTNEDEARDAFNQLSGDTHASVKTGLIDTANLTADAINNRLRSAFAGVAAKDTPVLSFAQSPKGSASQPFDAVAPVSYDYGVWASGFGSWVDHDGNANTGGLKSTTGGFLSGVDVGFASGWRLGVVGGYSQTDLDAKGRFASATSDNWHLGVYGGNQWGPIGLRAGLVHTWHSIDSSRSVAYTGFNDSLDADYDARTFQAFGELGYRIDTAAASFEPFANLSHVRLHTDGFTEKGGAAALSVNSETTSTTFTTLGLRASAPLQFGATTANLKGTLGWRHAYGDITPESTQYFAGSNAFTVEGVAIAKDAALVEAGFDVAITEASTFGVSYVGQFGSDTTQNGFNATLNVKF
ncbi:hypothetical protein DK867_04480 [Ochrobactrum sp. POC9]|uniref:autotransporter domain-containing protein n=1 Tax=Ochrobactrum sp. POC9 TaxID=2203419 RepID=UPI000D706334|nr:autotransporter domain-containing protein [Ochrobactrum sp. POC9]PWU76512.1 hypothetical protein DK867_04480 [Ochrobactrum sp. POC9]